MVQFEFTRAKKKLGQHWLVDKNIINKIVDAAELSANDIVIEIGTGTGILTYFLAEKVKHVFSYDIDEEAQSVARKNLKNFKNITFIHKDILKEEKPFSDITGKPKCKIVANIPYQITTPIINIITKNNNDISSAVLLLQKELGDRMIAKPRNKNYGRFTLFVQYHFMIKKIWKVSRNCFKPSPNVDSLVIKMTPHQKPPVHINNDFFFFNIIKAAFGNRRKFLLNALNNFTEFDFNKKIVTEVFYELKIDKKIRGEELDLNTFAQISNILFDRHNGPVAK